MIKQFGWATAIALLSTGALAQSFSVSGDTTGSPTFDGAQDPNNGFTNNCLGNCPYDSYNITIVDPANFSADISAGSFDTYLYLYEGAFDPSNPTANLAAVDDDDGAGLFSLINSANDGPLPAGNAIIVVSGYSGGFGTYTLDVNGATQGFVVAVNPAPGAFGAAVNGFNFLLAEAKYGAMDRITAVGLGARREAASMAARAPSNLTTHKPVVTDGGMLANNLHIWGDLGYLAGDVDFGDTGSLGYTQIGFDLGIDPDMLVGVAVGFGLLDGGDNGLDVDGKAYWVQPYVGFDFGFLRGVVSGSYGYTDYTENTFFGVAAGADSTGGSGHVFVAHDLDFGSLTVSPYVEATAGNERFSNFSGVLAGTPDTNVLYLDSALGLEVRHDFTFASGGTFTGAGVYGRAEGEYRYADHDFVTTTTDDYSGISAGFALGASATVGENMTFMLEGKADGIGSDFESYGGNVTVSIGF